MVQNNILHIDRRQILLDKILCRLIDSNELFIEFGILQWLSAKYLFELKTYSSFSSFFSMNQKSPKLQCTREWIIQVDPINIRDGSNRRYLQQFCLVPRYMELIFLPCHNTIITIRSFEECACSTHIQSHT